MSYEKQCLIDIMLFSWFVLKNCWLYIAVCLGINYLLAKQIARKICKKLDI